jgi:hypothetical protein
MTLAAFVIKHLVRVILDRYHFRSATLRGLVPLI